MPARKLTNIAIRQQVFLERLKTHEVKDFTAVFAKIDRATREVLNALEVNNLGELTRKQLNNVLAQLRKANADLLDQSVNQLYTRLEEIAAYTSEFEGKTFDNVSKGQFALEIPSAEAAYKFALQQPMSATGQFLPDFLNNWTDGEVARLNNAVTRAWGEGWTVQDLTKAIRGTKALNYKDGILTTSRRNAETIGRTAIQHVASSARLATLEQNKDIAGSYRFVATLDSHTTAECRSLDGKEFPLGEGPVPPLHYNCRSTIVAVLNDKSLDFLDEGATRSSEVGPVPADQSYYEWLQDQPSSFQDEVLGPVRGQLFREGGLSAQEFADLQLGKNFQPLTLDEMRQLEPLAFEKAGIPEQ